MKIRKRKRASGAVRYEVDFGVIDGKRKQQLFKTRREADIELDKIKDRMKNHGSQSFSVTEEERIRFATARDRLARVGATIEQAVDHYMKTARPMKPMPMQELMGAFICAKECAGKRKRYTQQLKCSCKAFVAGRELVPAHEVSREEVVKWVHSNGWAPKTQSVYMGDVRTMFAWALKEKHATVNPCLEIELATAEPEEVVTMKLREAERLLIGAHWAWDCEAKRPFADLLGYVALGLFCGIRPEELQRSSVEVLDLDHSMMTVLGRHAKTRQRRVVDVSANGVAWLREWRRLCPDQKQIIPKNFKRRWERFRIACAWKLPWPHDVMRHTFASMHYAAYQDEAKLQAMMGHESKEVLFTNYRGLTKPTEARLFWELRPAGEPAPVKVKKKVRAFSSKVPG